ncbi:uncharacterized protein LOC122850380 [Aphidius gifuensis]|uniref:uncharacterized protein LOC122850380 n=1 Tax=Aphidius gifuensis TaxID=684658 RepID=UPI001CDBEAE6|nr:uncharacterized protein LOC122850380 [Aphidius gifuensis]
MPANRVKRSVEDEREFQRLKRMRNTVTQRERRQKLALQLESKRFNIQVEDIQEHYIGKMNILCQHCSAKHFKVEEVNNKKTFNDCCSHGEVNLEPLPDPPHLIKDLFNRSHKLSKNFHERIRSYNNAFAFASFNANLNEATNVWSQLNKVSSLNTEIINAIGNTLREINLFAKSYRMMHEELQQTINDGHEEPEMQLIFSNKPGMDARRYNMQKINEVAAIFTTTANGDIPESYVTIHNKKTKKLKLNQKKIRADSYQGLIDHLKTAANESKVNVEKMNDTLIDENGYPTYCRRNTGTFERENGNSTEQK